MIQAGYKAFRDLIVFTNLRLIFIDAQGLVGSKKEFMSVPYESIVRFSVESAGTFDLDSEKKVWVSGSSSPIQKKFSREAPVRVVQQMLGRKVLARRQMPKEPLAVETHAPELPDNSARCPHCGKGTEALNFCNHRGKSLATSA